LAYGYGPWGEPPMAPRPGRFPQTAGQQPRCLRQPIDGTERSQKACRIDPGNCRRRTRSYPLCPTRGPSARTARMGPGNSLKIPLYPNATVASKLLSVEPPPPVGRFYRAENRPGHRLTSAGDIPAPRTPTTIAAGPHRQLSRLRLTQGPTGAAARSLSDAGTPETPARMARDDRGKRLLQGIILVRKPRKPIGPQARQNRDPATCSGPSRSARTMPKYGGRR